MPSTAEMSSRAGSRIRERRLKLGMTQSGLARRLEISASYLNLIEHNRRRIGGKLLLDIADALVIAPQFLSEGAEVAKVAGLRAASARSPDVEVEASSTSELAERFPGWANLLLDQSARIQRLEATVAKLSDRLAHDPHLAESLHEMISTVTAIRSSAAILKDTPDLEPAWRARFQRNLVEESERLVAGSRRLAGYLDAGSGPEFQGRAPQDEFMSFLKDNGYRFPSLEGSEPTAPLALVDSSDALRSSPARSLALRHLERYRTEAAQLPARRLAEAMEAAGQDPVRAASELGLPLPVVLRRIIALPVRRGAPEPGLASCNGSGTLTFAKPAEGFELSLLGHPCPLWPLYRALQRPMSPISGAIALPGEAGGRFRTWSVADETWPEGLGGPPVVEATMLILPEPEGAETALPVGMACAICPRGRCVGRHEPSILSSGL